MSVVPNKSSLSLSVTSDTGCTEAFELRLLAERGLLEAVVKVISVVISVLRSSKELERRREWPLSVTLAPIVSCVSDV